MESDHAATASDPVAGKSNGRVKLRLSCDNCSYAKVRCTKDRPLCSRCLNMNLPCNYAPSRRAGKPSKSARKLPSGNISNSSESSPTIGALSASSSELCLPSIGQQQAPPANSAPLPAPLYPQDNLFQGSSDLDSMNFQSPCNLNSTSYSPYSSLGEGVPFSSPLRSSYDSSAEPSNPPSRANSHNKLAFSNSMSPNPFLNNSAASSNISSMQDLKSTSTASSSNTSTNNTGQGPFFLPDADDLFSLFPSDSQLYPIQNTVEPSQIHPQQSSSDQCDCSSLTLKTLGILQHAPSSNSSTPAALDSLTLYQTVVSNVSSLVSCSSCPPTEQSILLVTSMITQVLKGYSTYRNLQSHQFVDLTLGTFKVDGEDEGRFKVQIVERELTKVEALLEKFKTWCERGVEAGGMKNEQDRAVIHSTVRLLKWRFKETAENFQRASGE